MKTRVPSFRSSVRTFALICGLATTSLAQLEPGDFAVVTTDGFFGVRATTPPSLPVVHVPPAGFGLSALVSPGVAWIPGSDDFVVTSGESLFRVRVLAGGTTVTDITPASGGTLHDPDVHLWTDELLLLDTAGHQALFFEPPFAAGMTPHRVLPVPQGTRTLTFNSRSLPSVVNYATSTQFGALMLDGSAPPQPLAPLGHAFRIDDVPTIKAQVLFTSPSAHIVGRLNSAVPTVWQALNIVYPFCEPAALAPRSVSYDSSSPRILVLASNGVNPACMPGVVGPNHVVALPPAQGPMAAPALLTAPSGSGITGALGDLALVHAPFAYVSPWGSGCALGATPTFDAAPTNVPTSPHPGFNLEIRQAPANSPTWFIAGFEQIDVTLPSSCRLLVKDAVPLLLVGQTDNTGLLDLPLPIPAGLPPGLVLLLQPAFTPGGFTALGNALALHIAP